MITLGIETTTSHLSVAIIKDDTALSVSERNDNMLHSVNIMPMIEFILNDSEIKKTDINLISVDNGPGAFTSIRTGVSTARALSQFANIPIVAVSSLEVLLENARKIIKCWISDTNSNYNDCIIVPMIDAKKKRVYVSISSFDNIIEANLDIDPHKLIDKLIRFKKRAILIGNACDIYKDLWIEGLGNNAIFIPPKESNLNAVDTALLGRKKFLESGDFGYNNIIPNYIRMSDAEIIYQRDNL